MRNVFGWIRSFLFRHLTFKDETSWNSKIAVSAFRPIECTHLLKQYSNTLKWFSAFCYGILKTKIKLHCCMLLPLSDLCFNVMIKHLSWIPSCLTLNFDIKWKFTELSSALDIQQMLFVKMFQQWLYNCLILFSIVLYLSCLFRLLLIDHIFEVDFHCVRLFHHRNR